MDMEKIIYGPSGNEPRSATWVKKSGNPGAVVAVGARCALRAAERRARSSGKLAVEVEEFVELDDGSRMSIRWDRGFTVSLNGSGRLSELELLEHLEGALLPDEGEAEDQGERRSWHEYALLLAAQGISATARELKGLPYRTELSAELRDQLLT